MYATLLWTLLRFPKIDNPLVVYRFYCMALFHSQTLRHIIKKCIGLYTIEPVTMAATDNFNERTCSLWEPIAIFKIIFCFTFVSDHITDFLRLYSVQVKNMYSYLNSSLKLSDIVRGLSCQQKYCN